MVILEDKDRDDEWIILFTTSAKSGLVLNKHDLKYCTRTVFFNI